MAVSVRRTIFEKLVEKTSHAWNFAIIRVKHERETRFSTKGSDGVLRTGFKLSNIAKKQRVSKAEKLSKQAQKSSCVPLKPTNEKEKQDGSAFLDTVTPTKLMF